MSQQTRAASAPQHPRGLTLHDTGMFIVTPSTSQPCSLSRCAAMLLSTPPLIITAICLEPDRPSFHGDRLDSTSRIFHLSTAIVSANLSNHTPHPKSRLSARLSADCSRIRGTWDFYSNSACESPSSGRYM